MFNVTFEDDMGHLTIAHTEDNNNLPRHIADFAYKKAREYVETQLVQMGSSSGSGSGSGSVWIKVHHMKPGCQPKWTYACGNETVNIDFGCTAQPQAQAA